MSTIDQQFVEYIVKTLVNNPDKVSVTRKLDEKGVLLILTLDPEDIGRIIGKRGATAQSIRTLLRALGTKNDARYNLKIAEAGAPIATDSSESSDSASSESSPDSSDNTESSEETEDSSHLAESTRAELADLDDLEI